MKASQAEIDAFLLNSGVTAGPLAKIDDVAHCAPYGATLDPNSATIPLPISTNHIWRSIITYVRGKPRVKVIKTKKYREWIVAALPMVRHMAKRERPVEAEIEICGTNQRPDLDNFCKGIFDLLRLAEVLKGDNIKHVRRITICWHPDKIDGKEMAIVTLRDAAI